MSANKRETAWTSDLAEDEARRQRKYLGALMPASTSLADWYEGVELRLDEPVAVELRQSGDASC